MNRTFTPRLGPAVLKRLEAYAERFRPHFNRSRQALWGGVYLRGLLLEGERKSIEPLSRRVSLPAALGPVADPECGGRDRSDGGLCRATSLGVARTRPARRLPATQRCWPTRF